MNVKMAQALLLSLLLHLILVLLLIWSQSRIEPKKPTTPYEKREFSLSDFTRYAKPIQEEPVSTQTTKAIPQPQTQQQPQIKQTIQPQTPKKQTTQPKTPTTSNGILANALMQQGQPIKPQNIDNETQKIIKNLYGNSFNSFTQTQKDFITENLSKIHRITQNTLTLNGYPEVALKTMQQGTNVVVFDLHPNGDITNLKLKQAMGYKLLDDNTLHVIRIAYKNYPKPKTTTTIMFYVEYKIGY